MSEPLSITELLSRLRCSVTLSDGETIELANRVIETPPEAATCQAHYTDEHERSKLTLHCFTVDGVTLGHVSAQVAFSEPAFKRNPTFAPDHGLTLRCPLPAGVDGVLAHYMHKDWWSRPWFGLDLNQVPPRTQSLLWKRGDLYYYLLPVVSERYRAELCGSEGALEVQLSSNVSGYRLCEALAFAFCVGDNPFELPERAVAAVLKQLGYPTRLRHQKAYPEVLDHLGWCTWDAFYHQVTAEDILAKAEEFEAKQVPIRWVMIDDGWMTTRESMLCRFQPDDLKFPNGLGPVVQKLKTHHGVKWVGVWHTVLGYWVGVDPDGEIAEKLKGALYETKLGRLIPKPTHLAGLEFWNQWHGWLKAEGIDFVKVDGQSSLPNLLREEFSAGEGARASHAALEASIGIHFNQTVINCMGMAADNLWNRPASAVSRSSDDFVPSGEIPFSEHALQNAYNSVYHGVFYWGDWDMFWSSHAENIRHAVLRAVSGGPIYVSDKLGATDAEVIRPLVLLDGRILRADHPGLPTRDCLFADPTANGVALKIWSSVGEARTIAAYHLVDSEDSARATISATDVGHGSGGQYLLYDYFNRTVTRLSGAESMSFAVGKDQVALFHLLPETGPFTPIGALDKYLSPAILEVWQTTPTGARVTVCEGCLFGCVTGRPISAAIAAGRALDIEHLGAGLYTLECSSLAGPVEIELTF